jgi:formamidopyrimidine-DNA glycosylase
MPELPEVETVVRGLQKSIFEKTIGQVRLPGILKLRSPLAEFISFLPGGKINEILRHGKAIQIKLSKGKESRWWKIHLGMTGQLLVVPSESILEPHTHGLFTFKSSLLELRFVDIRRFGWMELNRASVKSSVPDAWLSPPSLLRKALRQSRGLIKPALLSQKLITGLGNIYIDESLYRAKIHPQTLLQNISDKKLGEFCRIARDILGSAIAVGGTSYRNYIDIHGRKGGYLTQLQVYGRDGSRCHCGEKIIKMIVGGRGTHVCPGCQGEGVKS